jgi:hypothetical protein
MTIRRLLRSTAFVACVLAGTAFALAGCGGSSRNSQSPTGSTSSKLPSETQAEGKVGNVTPPPPRQPGELADPDSLNMGGSDVEWVVHALGNGRYSLRITNTSRIGFVDDIDWKPPRGDKIRKVGESTAGACSLANGRVSCSGLKLKPPTCLCRPGGTATVIFTMEAPDVRGGLVSGALQILGMTPVPWTIPSEPGERKSE